MINGQFFYSVSENIDKMIGKFDGELVDLSDRRKERFKTTFTLENVDFCCEEIDHLVPWHLTEIDLCDLYKSVFFY